jgi:hypothetical protein
MSAEYPKFRTAILLGSIGWLLLLFPALFRDYGLIVSGELFRLMATLLSGTVRSHSDAVQVGFLGLQVGPVAASAAILALYAEESGYLRSRVRQVTAFLAAAFLFASAGIGIWLFRDAVNAAGYAGPLPSTAAIMNATHLCSWSLLFVVFGVSQRPLRSTWTRGITALIALEASILTVIFVYAISRQWSIAVVTLRPTRLLTDAIAFAPWPLILAFLAAMWRESTTLRRHEA